MITLLRKAELRAVLDAVSSPCYMSGHTSTGYAISDRVCFSVSVAPPGLFSSVSDNGCVRLLYLRVQRDKCFQQWVGFVDLRTRCVSNIFHNPTKNSRYRHEQLVAAFDLGSRG